MKRKNSFLLIVLLALNALSFSADTEKPKTKYAAEVQKWRAEQENDLRKDDGWLTVDGLFWLKPGNNEFGSDPANAIALPAPASPRMGSLELKDGKVYLHSQGSANVRVNGVAPSENQELRFSVEEKPDKIQIGNNNDLTMFVIQRGDRFAVRLKNKNSKARREFKGRVWYPVETRLRIEADFVPYNPPKQISVPNVLGTQNAMPSPGRAEFTINGQKVSLEPVLEEDDPKELFFIFKDKTATNGTYGSGRFLYTGLPSKGKLILDFNKAENPPCAFTPYATCPLPPRQNVLTVAIPAGEKVEVH